MRRLSHGRPGPLFCLFCILIPLASPATLSADWNPLISRLIEDRFEENAIQELFLRPELQFSALSMSKKIDSLLRMRQRMREAGRRTETTRVKRDYLRADVISRARTYRLFHRSILEDLRKIYGVPGEIVVSIVLVETKLGRYMGERSVFSSLASMALSRDFDQVRSHLSQPLRSPEDEDFARDKCRQKAEWAYDELKALIVYARYAGLDPLAIRGSIYGAFGLCQFMPSSVLRYGVDGDGDGRIDLFSEADALHSIANYLKGHGWKEKMDRPSQEKVIYGYNNSSIYVNTVLAVAGKLKGRIDK